MRINIPYVYFFNSYYKHYSNKLYCINKLRSITLRVKLIKLMYYIITSIFIIIFLISSYLQITYHKFNSNNVKNLIELISSNQFEGRLAGSYGNNKAAFLMENNFKKYNINPLESSYMQSFELISPIKNNSSAELCIKDSSNVIKNYKYGVDFKEDFTNFKTSTITFNKSDNVSIFSKSFVITQNNKSFLFYVSFDKNFNFRSSFNIDSPYDFSIAINTQVFNELLTALRNNNSIYVNLPYELHTCEVSNVIGILQGKSHSLPPLVLCAHFDHIGVDCLGHYYNGALDNASGTAFLLELSKNLSTFIKPERDIIFAAFNAEEFGLLGSEKFAEKYKYILKDSKVINFDMIGSSNVPINIVNGNNFLLQTEKSSSQLSNSLENICIQKHLNYNVTFQDCSDHASFTNLGIDSVTLCNSDLSKIHTPNDTVKYIDTKSIDDIYSVAISEIYNQAYNQNLFFIYNYETSLFSLISSLLLIILPNIYLIKKRLRHAFTSLQ